MARLQMTPLDGGLWLSLSSLGGAAKTAETGYPPYNIELFPADERSPEILRVTFAVAGFAPGEVEVSVEDGQLTVSGSRLEEGPKEYLHRGIAARKFRRTFALARGVEVRKAELHNGLLAIDLERPHKEKQVLKVGIVTVFRTLKSLTACGIAREITLGDGLTRFEHSYHHPHHHHIVCTECHKAIEFISPELESIQDAIVRKYHFQALHHRFQIYGLCEDCREHRPVPVSPACLSPSRAVRPRRRRWSPRRSERGDRLRGRRRLTRSS